MTIEFEVRGGRACGTVPSRYGASLAFAGADELERALAMVSAPAAASALPGVERLTLSEREVLNAVLAGCSNSEAADALLYSVKSIEAYLTRIYRTLGLQGRDELLALRDGARSRRAAAPARGAAAGATARRAAIEFEVGAGGPSGVVTVEGGAPIAFGDVRELERALTEGGVRTAGDPLDALTPVEREIVDAVVSGSTNREIATALFYSVKSIEAHLTRIYRKLDVGSRRELAELCSVSAVR